MECDTYKITFFESQSYMLLDVMRRTITDTFSTPEQIYRTIAQPEDSTTHLKDLDPVRRIPFGMKTSEVQPPNNAKYLAHCLAL